MEESVFFIFDADQNVGSIIENGPVDLEILGGEKAFKICMEKNRQNHLFWPVWAIGSN